MFSKIFRKKDKKGRNKNDIKRAVSLSICKSYLSRIYDNYYNKTGSNDGHVAPKIKTLRPSLCNKIFFLFIAFGLYIFVHAIYNKMYEKFLKHILNKNPSSIHYRQTLSMINFIQPCVLLNPQPQSYPYHNKDDISLSKISHVLD